MQIKFPENFQWGTSTAAAQIETASAHNWRGVNSKDGYVFERTSDHELRREEDIEYITQFGDVYRCGVDWARLQTEAFAPFVPDVVEEYQRFFQALNERGTRIMFVFHHFTNPLWLEEKKAFADAENIPAFLDYAQQCITHFGQYVYNWNTFNEPNVYAFNGYFAGNFPPFKSNYFLANRVIGNMAKAHNHLYKMLKEQQPQKPVGISLNTCYFKAKNILGLLPARIADWWFIWRTADLFKQVDYCGLSYYAYILFDPFPITEIDRPGDLDQLGLPRDDMWAYYPEGFGVILRKIWQKYKKPIIITENGICTANPQKRIDSIKDYLQICHKVIQEGVDLRGYMHWSTWDNFEWNLGPTYRFGLVTIDLETKDRTMTAAGDFYSKITRANGFSIEEKTATEIQENEQ